MVSVMIEREILDKLDAKLETKGLTRAQWVRECIRKELGDYSVQTSLSVKCPHCGKVAKTEDEINKLFGWRKVNGNRISQSWCFDCRTGGI